LHERTAYEIAINTCKYIQIVEKNNKNEAITYTGITIKKIASLKKCFQND